MSNPLRNRIRKKRKSEAIQRALEFLKAAGDRPIFGLAPDIQAAAEELLPKTKFQSLAELVGTAVAIGLQAMMREIRKQDRPLVEVVGHAPKSALEKLAAQHREAEERVKGVIRP